MLIDCFAKKPGVEVTWPGRGTARSIVDEARSRCHTVGAGTRIREHTVRGWGQAGCFLRLIPLADQYLITLLATLSSND